MAALIFFTIDKLLPVSNLCQTDQVTDFMVWSHGARFQFDIFPPTILKVAAETRISEGK